MQKNGVIVTYIVHCCLLYLLTFLLTSVILITQRFFFISIFQNNVTWRSFIAVYRYLIIYVHTFSDILEPKGIIYKDTDRFLGSLNKFQAFYMNKIGEISHVQTVLW